MSLALYQPDIPQNVGSLIRLASCMEVPLHIIEPCGFAFDDRKIKRAAMDYYQYADIQRHVSWQQFLMWRQAQRSFPRLLLLTTKGAVNYTEFAFAQNDILLLGQESAGAPEEVHAACDARLRIPINANTRSLNVALAAAMALGEMKRQTSLGAERSNPEKKSLDCFVALRAPRNDNTA